MRSECNTYEGGWGKNTVKTDITKTLSSIVDKKFFFSFFDIFFFKKFFLDIYTRTSKRFFYETCLVWFFNNITQKFFGSFLTPGTTFFELTSSLGWRCRRLRQSTLFQILGWESPNNGSTYVSCTDCHLMYVLQVVLQVLQCL
jgi:hypothetical protein